MIEIHQNRYVLIGAWEAKEIARFTRYTDALSAFERLSWYDRSAPRGAEPEIRDAKTGREHGPWAEDPDDLEIEKVEATLTEPELMRLLGEANMRGDRAFADLCQRAIAWRNDRWRVAVTLWERAIAAQ